MLEYGALDRNTFFPPLLCKKITVPNSAVLTLLTPYTLINGVAGKVIVPEKAFVVKPAGTAYTIAGITSFGIGVGSYSLMAVSAADFAGFLDNSSQSMMLSPGNYNKAGVSVTTINPLVGTPALAANVTIFTVGASPAAGTSDLYVYLTFRVWDVAPLGWF